MKKLKFEKPVWWSGVLSFLWFLLIIIPIYFAIINTFKTRGEYNKSNPLIPGFQAGWDNYIRVFENDVVMYFVNTILVTVISVFLMVFCSILAAYAIVRNSSKLSIRLYSIFLLGLAIPAQACILPVYYIILKMNFYDTLVAIILPSVAFGIPITLLIIINFMRDVPASLFESMSIDGASTFRILFALVIPLTKPAIITVSIYNALGVWNGFIYPLILTQSQSLRTLPLSLWAYQGQYTSDTPVILAAVIISLLPILAAYIVGRKQMIAGLASGFSK